MTTKIKFKKLDLNFVKKNYPVLFDTIDDLFKTKVQADGVSFKEAKEYIAGLCLEIALKSDGTTDIFEEDMPLDFLGENEFDEDY